MTTQRLHTVRIPVYEDANVQVIVDEEVPECSRVQPSRRRRRRQTSSARRRQRQSSRQHRIAARSTVVQQPAIPMPSLPSALTPSEIGLLRSYVTQADEDGARFHAAADRCRRRHAASNFVLLLLLWATSGGSILYDLSTLEVSGDAGFVTRVTIDVMLAVAAVLQTLQQVCRYDKKLGNYESTGDAFYNYAREWRLRIAQGVDDRRAKCEVALVLAESSLSEIENNAMAL